MTLSEVSALLGTKPDKATVYNRIRREANRRQLPLGSVFADGQLTPEAVALVHLIVADNRTTTPRGEPIVRDDTRETLAAYERLRQEHEILRGELSRVTAYLDDTDRLLGQLVRSFSALEERIEAVEERKRESFRERLAGAFQCHSRQEKREHRLFLAFANVLRRG